MLDISHGLNDGRYLELQFLAYDAHRFIGTGKIYGVAANAVGAVAYDAEAIDLTDERVSMTRAYETDGEMIGVVEAGTGHGTTPAALLAVANLMASRAVHASLAREDLNERGLPSSLGEAN